MQPSWCREVSFRLEPLPQRLLYVEPLRRHMRVRFGGAWIADSEHVLLLFEPGRYLLPGGRRLSRPCDAPSTPRGISPARTVYQDVSPRS
jgi:hypothetical protein